MGKIITIIPTTKPVFAVYGEDDRTRYREPVIAWALVEEDGERRVIGMEFEPGTPYLYPSTLEQFQRYEVTP